MPSCFGGASDAQTQDASAQQSFANSITQNMNSRISAQNANLGQLQNILTGVQNGKLLPGFSSATLGALNTSALDTTASNYRNAAQTVQNATAGAGGNSGLLSGVQAQLREQQASQSAGQLSAEQQKIQLANQQQAQQNTSTAIGGYNALAAAQDPLGFAKQAQSSQSAAFGENSELDQLANQKLSNELSFGTSVALDAATFGAGGMAGLGASPAGASQPGAFFQGGFNALSGGGSNS
jgi:hypothetical protein